MYEEYFVLVSEEFFGVFELNAKYYPDVFRYNLDKVVCIGASDVEAYLLKRVGRNALVKSGFHMFTGLNHIFYRFP